MKRELKMAGSLHQQMLEDLRRPHPFAYERVGFCQLRQTTIRDGILFLAMDYMSLPDGDYLEDEEVGAKIGTDALRKATHLAFYGRASRTGVLHVHLHNHLGPTFISRTDARSLPDLVQSWRATGPVSSHGFLILSGDHGLACITEGGQPFELQEVDRISVIGPGIKIFKHEERDVE